MGYPIKQSTTAQPLVFFMTDTADHITGKTGLSPTVKLSKNGAAGVSPSGAVSQIDSTNHPGWYQVAGNATDSNTLGPLILHASSAGADPADDTFIVVSYDPQNATSLGLSNLNAPIALRTGTCQTGSTTSTIKLDASTSGLINLWHGCLVWITGGTGAGQSRLIINDNGTTTATIYPTWSIDPDATSTFAIIPQGQCDLIANQQTPFTFPANFGSMAVDVSGNVTANVASFLAAAMAQLTSGKITFSAPLIDAGGAFTVIQGASYYAGDGQAIVYTMGASPDITSATAVMKIGQFGTTPISITGAISGGGTSTQVISFDITSAITAILSVGSHDYDIDITLSNGHLITKQGRIVVKSQVG